MKIIDTEELLSPELELLADEINHILRRAKESTAKSAVARCCR